MSTPTLNAGSRAAAEIASLLRARNPLVWITTKEEARAERLLMEAAQAAQYEPRFWDCSTGITDYAGKPQEAGAACTDPAQVLATIRDTPRRQVWILRDLTPWLRDPSVTRALRSLARALTLAPREQARAVILLTPSSEIPPELAGHAIAFEFPLPDRAEIAAILEARTAARLIARRVQKAGESAAQVVAECSTQRIESARFAFLDLDEPRSDVQPEAPGGRGVDLDPAPARSAAAPQLPFALEV